MEWARGADQDGTGQGGSDEMRLLLNTLGSARRGKDGDLLKDGPELSRCAKVSAGVAAPVQEMRFKPKGTTMEFVRTIKEELGVHHGEARSLDRHAEEAMRGVAGHKSLKKKVKILGHLFELQREFGASPEVEAFTAQSCKASVEALNHNGDWTMCSPLLGLVDTEQRHRSVMSSAKRVAMVDLVKEEGVLESARKAAARPPYTGNATPVGKVSAAAPGDG